MKKLIVIVSVFLTACTSRQVATTVHQPAASISINGKLFATIFQQRAAEYRALCFQAFNIAAMRLEQYKPTSSKPLIVITDIDETILDNSPYEAHQTLQGKDYEPASWHAWTDKAAADTVPGAAAFLKYAASKSVEIFYVSNRDLTEVESTMNNLKKFDLPNADRKHLLFKETTSSKEVRRQALAANYEIVLLLGDNLADFSSLFDRQPTKDMRMENTNVAASQFGDRFIVIPNSVYGDWEGSLFKFTRLSQAQKDSVIRAEVKSY